MTLKSAARRGTLITVALASALGLAACSSGQLSQTADQVAAVDGAQNEQPAITAGVAIRDAHIVVNPDTSEASVKFTAVNQDRSDLVYTLKSVTVEGAGDVSISPETETKGAADYNKDPLELPNGCSLVATNKRDLGVIAEGADKNNSCISYVVTDVDNATLVGSKSTAAGLNRMITFTFTASDGTTKTIEVDSTVSAFIPEAGEYTNDSQDHKSQHSAHADHRDGGHH